jgi:micrococcal nuclease
MLVAVLTAPPRPPKPVATRTIVVTPTIVPTAPAATIVPTAPAATIVPTAPAATIVPTAPEPTIVPTAPEPTIVPTAPEPTVVPTAPVPANSASPQNTGIPQDAIAVPVIKVTDGDTIHVRIDGKNITIRMIGIDTPETVDPRKPVQCFGKEASNHAHQLLDGTTVYLEQDASQGDYDKYNRLLRYIWLADGRMFNQVMIAEGYAFEYTYNVPYKYQSQFKDAQRNAQNQQIGLWSPTTCNGVASDVTPVP